MRIGCTILAAALAASLTGCGNRLVVLEVDVLSYLGPGQSEATFGPVPAFPGGLATGEQPLVDDVEVNLLEGFGSLVEIRSVAFSLTALVHDSTGTGLDTLRVYLSDANTLPLETPPVVERAVILTPGVTDTVEVHVEGDARVVSLFAGRRVRLSVTTSVRGPAAGDPLTGRIHLTALDARVAGARASW